MVCLYYGYYGPDRRKAKRVIPINRPIEVRMLIGNREINALLIDLSGLGMSVLTKYDIPVKTIILIKFTLTDKYANKDENMRTMEITGEVRRKALLKNNKYRLGIAFISISQEDKYAITNFVNYTVKMVKIMAVVAIVAILASIVIPLIVVPLLSPFILPIWKELWR